MSYLYSGNSAAKCYCIFESFVCTKYNNVLFISRLMKNTAVNPSMSRNPVLSRIGPLIWDLYTVSVSQGPNKVSRAMHGSVPPFHYLVDGPNGCSEFHHRGLQRTDLKCGCRADQDSSCAKSLGRKVLG